MLDNLREQVSSGSFFQGEESPSSGEGAPHSKKPAGSFLGMTSKQRFILSVMLLLTICIVGTMCLLVTERFALFK